MIPPLQPTRSSIPLAPTSTAGADGAVQATSASQAAQAFTTAHNIAAQWETTGLGGRALASAAANESSQNSYEQALALWEAGGQPDEKRSQAAQVIRTCLADPEADPFNPWHLSLCAMGLRVAPPIPAGTRVLSLNLNPLTQLAELPDSLESLSVCGCLLAQFPALPPGLKHLEMSSMQSAALPALPATLTSLGANRCRLEGLPEAWPPHLSHLSLTGNNLTHVPPLPEALTQCYLNDNLLTQLPENYAVLTARRATIYLAGNPLSPDSLQTIQELRQARESPGGEGVVTWEADDSDESDDSDGVDDLSSRLTDAVGVWHDHDAAALTRWQAFEAKPEAQAFARFLGRLAQSVNLQSPQLGLAFRANVAAWLGALAGNALLRAETFLASSEADTTCADRAVLSYLHMTRLGAAHDVRAGAHDDNPQALFAIAKSVMRQEALEGIAAQWVADHPTMEEIEVHLAFLTQRSNRLELSLSATAMNFLSYADVPQIEFDRAATAVEALDSNFPRFLSNWEPWRSVLQRWDAERFSVAQQRLYDSLENGDFMAHARTEGFVGPGATHALYHATFGPLTEAYVEAHGLRMI